MPSLYDIEEEEYEKKRDKLRTLERGLPADYERGSISLLDASEDVIEYEKLKKEIEKDCIYE